MDKSKNTRNNLDLLKVEKPIFSSRFSDPNIKNSFFSEKSQTPIYDNPYYTNPVRN